jgi:hypothetical protein
MLKSVPQVASMAPSLPSVPPLPTAARAALQQGRKIEAIKLVREAEGLGLKDAKDRVEHYVANDPLLKETFAASQSRTRNGCLLVGAGVLALGLYLYVRAKG